MADRLARAHRPPPPSAAASSKELAWALRALCLTEIVSWGVLYYAFPVLLPEIAADTGWSTTALTAVFSAALVASGVAGIAVGRVMHRHGPRWVMTGGSVLAVTAIVLIATAPTFWLFVAGWLLAGVAMSGVLYAPAFTAVTVWFGPDRLRALTAITLVAGLASTVFAPLTAVLDTHLSWRGTYLALAAILAVLTIPVHFLALRPAWPQLDPPEANGEPTGPDEPAAAAPVDRRTFWLVTLAFTINAVCLYATVIGTVPLLHDRGYSATAAAWVLGIGGVGQVLGRLGYAALAHRSGLRARTVAIFGASAVTTALLAALPGPYALLLLVSLLAGNARGLATLLAATAVADRWGIARYARLNGVFNAPLMAASAIAPFLGAGLAALLGGYPAAFAGLAALGLIAVLLVARRGPDPG